MKCLTLPAWSLGLACLLAAPNASATEDVLEVCRLAVVGLDAKRDVVWFRQTCELAEDSLALEAPPEPGKGDKVWASLAGKGAGTVQQEWDKASFARAKQAPLREVDPLPFSLGLTCSEDSVRLLSLSHEAASRKVASCGYAVVRSAHQLPAGNVLVLFARDAGTVSRGRCCTLQKHDTAMVARPRPGDLGQRRRQAERRLLEAQELHRRDGEKARNLLETALTANPTLGAAHTLLARVRAKPLAQASCVAPRQVEEILQHLRLGERFGADETQLWRASLQVLASERDYQRAIGLAPFKAPDLGDLVRRGKTWRLDGATLTFHKKRVEVSKKRGDKPEYYDFKAVQAHGWAYLELTPVRGGDTLVAQLIAEGLRVGVFPDKPFKLHPGRIDWREGYYRTVPPPCPPK